MELRRTETGFALYKEKEIIGHCTLHPAAQGAALAALAALRAPIDRFFDEVMVMDKDEQLRDNRLKLLNRFEVVFSGIANIGELARKK